MTGAPAPSRSVRHFLRDDDLSPGEQAAVLDLALQLKARELGMDTPVYQLQESHHVR